MFEKCVAVSFSRIFSTIEIYLFLKSFGSHVLFARAVSIFQGAAITFFINVCLQFRESGEKEVYDLFVSNVELTIVEVVGQHISKKLV